jgi:antirestriction protein
MNLYDDVIDVRDIIERLEELEALLHEHLAKHDDSCIGDWAEVSPEEHKELSMLVALMEEMAGYGGDEQWRGDWYPLTLIRESHFTDYVQEMLEDCGEIPKDLPHYIHIDWQATARDVQVDYTPIDVDGATYFYR